MRRWEPKRPSFLSWYTCFGDLLTCSMWMTSIKISSLKERSPGNSKFGLMIYSHKITFHMVALNFAFILSADSNWGANIMGCTFSLCFYSNKISPFNCRKWIVEWIMKKFAFLVKLCLWEKNLSPLKILLTVQTFWLNSVNMSKIIASCIHPPICSVHLFSIYSTPTQPGIDDTATEKIEKWIFYSVGPWWWPTPWNPLSSEVHPHFIYFVFKKLVSSSKAEILSGVFYDARHLTNTWWTRFNKSIWRCRWGIFQS